MCITHTYLIHHIHLIYIFDYIVCIYSTKMVYVCINIVKKVIKVTGDTYFRLRCKWWSPGYQEGT